MMTIDDVYHRKPITKCPFCRRQFAVATSIGNRHFRDHVENCEREEQKRLDDTTPQDTP